MKEQNKMTVKLSAVGNPDYSIGSHERDIVLKEKIVPVKNFNHASQVCQDYIAKWDLGGGNFTGGQIFKGGKQIANVSYNGRVWEASGKEIKI